MTYLISRPLFLAWCYCALIALSAIIYFILCHTVITPEPIALAQRELIRTWAYIASILLFPLTNVVRHIQLRLNQTMPLPDKADITHTAQQRYLITIIISASLSELHALFGLTLFILGDGYNNLSIFIGLSILAVFLYRPQFSQYQDIIEQLNMRYLSK